MIRRYVVIGAGAVGGALGAGLSAAGYDVQLVAHGEHGRRIRDHGLLVRGPTHVDCCRMPIIFGPDELRLSTRDILLLAVKTQDVERTVAEWAWRPIYQDGEESVGVAADLPIVTLQNGLAAEALAMRRFDHVYAATIAIAASYLSPGEIVLQSTPPVAALIWIGRHPSGSDATQERIAADFSRAGFIAFSVDDSHCHKAAKLLGSVANVLDLLTGPDPLREQARLLLRAETKEILTAAGFSLPPNDVLDYRGFELAILPVEGHVTGRLSTWQSHARGASSEVDYLNGEVVLLARQMGMDAPLNRRAQRLAGDGRLSAVRSLEVLLNGR